MSGWGGIFINDTKRRVSHEHGPNSRAGHTTGGQANAKSDAMSTMETKQWLKES